MQSRGELQAQINAACCLTISLSISGACGFSWALYVTFMNSGCWRIPAHYGVLRFINDHPTRATEDYEFECSPRAVNMGSSTLQKTRRLDCAGLTWQGQWHCQNSRVCGK